MRWRMQRLAHLHGGVIKNDIKSYHEEQSIRYYINMNISRESIIWWPPFMTADIAWLSMRWYRYPTALMLSPKNATKYMIYRERRRRVIIPARILINISSTHQQPPMLIPSIMRHQLFIHRRIIAIIFVSDTAFVLELWHYWLPEKIN